MDTAELVKFRELMQKAHASGPMDEAPDDDTPED
jgi:hypothetical protein